MLEKESKIYTDTFKWVKFNTVYVWWWTPTIITAKQTKRFYDILKNYFDLSEVKQMMTEWSPYTTTEDKMKVLAECWINKMTFWVQSLDSKTLKKNNRFQNIDDVKNAIQLARKYGIEYINLDLMTWIEDQDIDWFKETIDLIEDLKPTTVHVNAFWPTKNTTYTQLWNIYSLDDINYRNDMYKYGRKFEDHRSKIKELEKDNLQLYNAHNFNSSILWLWYWAISHAYSSIHYSKLSFSDYSKLVDGDKSIRFIWYKLDNNDEIISYLINNLRNWVYFDRFSKIFKLDLISLGIYKKIEKLIELWILVVGENIDYWKYVRFKFNSDLFSSIYSKSLYNDKLIDEFSNYIDANKKEFLNLQLRLKQFFTD